MFGRALSSQAGIVHECSPSTVRSAGTSVMRTISASVRMATPSSRPNSFETRSGASRNEKNTDDMMNAAAMMTRPTPAMP